MKKLSFLILSCLLCFAVGAQTDYYANKTAVAGTNVIYSVKSYPGTYVISNINNTHFDQPYKLLNGAPAPLSQDQYKVTFIYSNPNDIAKAILQEVFTSSQLTNMRNQNLGFDTDCILDTQTGNIIEIRFMFDQHPLLYSLPPDTWFSLEQKIKQRFKYTFPPLSKTVQFINVFIVWGFQGIFRED